MSKKKRKLHEISKEADIRYRGPISYQGFQALGWLCITAAAVLDDDQNRREVQREPG